MEHIIVIISTLIFTAFFSAMEIAFFSANKFKIELRSSQGDRVGKILSNYLKNTPRFISTIMIGNNISLVLYGLSFTAILDILFKDISILNKEHHPIFTLFIQTVLATVVVLMIAEYLPKILVRNNPERMLNNSAYLMNFFYRAFAPLVYYADILAIFLITKVFRRKYKQQESTFKKRDLHTYLMDTMAVKEGAPTVVDAKIFSRALDFNKFKVRDFMIPRTEIVALPINATLEQLRAKFIETELSRIIIYEESLENIKGYVHSLSLFRDPKTITDVIKPHLVVPESMAAHNLLTEFNENRKSIAIVVDEFGGTSGLVTIEDLVEQVFGDIQDEHDNEETETLTEQQLHDNEFIFSARLEVDYINQTYNLGLPQSPNYTTLSGLVLYHAERILAPGESITVRNFCFTVLQASHNRVDILKLERIVGEDK